MKRIISVIICVLLVFTLQAEKRYWQSVSFESINMSALPSNYVKSLYQDNEGFIWICTNNGLARYDGSDVVAYGKYLDGYTFLYEVIEDADGNLLLGTEKGLVLMDRITGNTELMLSGFSVSSIIMDAAGNIWAGGSGGLFCRNYGSEEFSEVEISVYNESVEEVIDLLEGPDGDIWITTWQKGLYIYDPPTRMTQVFREGKLMYSYVMHKDSSGTVWVGTWGEGLLKLSPDFMSSSDYEVFVPDPSDDTALLDKVIYSINDMDDIIFVGGQKGLSIYDPESDTFRSFTADGRRDGLPYNQVNSILVTATGNVYIGLYGGGMCLMKYKSLPYELDRLPEVKRKFSTNTVQSIYCDSDDILWLGVPDHGFIRYDSATGSAMKYDEIPAFKDLLSISTMLAVKKRACSHELCLGTYSEGLWLYDGVAGSVRVYSEEICPELTTNNILSIENDIFENLWIGSNNGAFVLQPDDVLYSMTDFLASGEYHDDLVSAISASKDGKVFLATADHGIAEIDVAKRSVRYHNVEGKDHPQFVNLLVDDNGNVWAGTQNDGLYFYDSEKDVLESRNPICNIESRYISNILRLPDGEIWVTTINEIVSFRYDPENDALDVTGYVSDAGVVFCRNTAVLLDDTVMIGTTEGLYRFNICDRIIPQGRNNTLALTDIIINGRSYRVQDLWDEDINHMDKVKVRKGDNVEIRYTLLDYDHYLSPIYQCSYNDVRKETAEQSLSFTASERETIVVIAHKSSGQVKVLAVVTGPDLYRILLMLVALLGCGAFVYYGFIRKKVVTGSGNGTEDHETITFEINTMKLPSSDQELLQKAIRTIQEHIGDSGFNQAEFIREMGISRTLLTDKLKKLTGYTPSSLIMEIRLKTAYGIIMSAEDKLRISDVAYSVGFNDAKYFSTTFRKRYGLTPKELMNKRLEMLSSGKDE